MCLKEVSHTRYRAAKFMKVAIEILNNVDGVNVASPFWVNVRKVFKNDAKLMQWLQMQAANLPWMKRQVDKIK